MDGSSLTESISEKELERIIKQSRLVETRHEELFSFVYDLRRSDFKISTPQFIAIQKLLVALVRNGENPINFRQLKTYLAPLICSSPEEQASFYEYFEQWLKTRQPSPVFQERIEEAEDFTEPAGGGTVSPQTDEKTGFGKWRIKPAHIAAALSIAALAAVAVISFYFFRTQTFTGLVQDNETRQPLADAEIFFGDKTYRSNQDGSFSFEYQNSSEPQTLVIRRQEYQTLDTSIEPNQTYGAYSLIREAQTAVPLPVEIPTTSPTVSVSPTPEPSRQQRQLNFYVLPAAALTLFIIYGLWLVWKRRQRKHLERWRERNQPDFKNLMLRKGENYLYLSPAFRRTVQELRRHRHVQTTALDIGFTVEATARQGGLFNPVFGRRQISPEYLILIDRLSFRDQKARLEDQIIECFKREGVFFECFYFSGDPRLCRQRTPNRKGELPKYFHLQELLMHYPEHRLLIFSDGGGMIDEFSGRPHHWLNLLSGWEVRALLTPNSASGYYKWLLEQEAGLPVLPAREADLKTLVEIIRTGTLPKIKTYAENADYPPTLLEEDFDQWWLRRVSPRPAPETEENEAEATADKVEMLCLELRYYLGKDGYLLLCACAVYPELLADLTFYLAFRLIEPAKREATLEALVCLPWFRHGKMPDWLREELLSDLGFEQEIKVRKAIEQLLMSYLEQPKQGFSLEIATRKKADRENWWKLWLQRRFLHHIIETEPENSPLKDYIFLRLISGSRLAVSLPRKLADFLESRNTSRFDFLNRFYEIGANIINSFSNLWKNVYSEKLPVDGVFRHIGFIIAVLAFTFVLAIALFLLPSPSADDVARKTDGNINQPGDVTNGNLNSDTNTNTSADANVNNSTPNFNSDSITNNSNSDTSPNNTRAGNLSNLQTGGLNVNTSSNPGTAGSNTIPSANTTQRNANVNTSANSRVATGNTNVNSGNNNTAGNNTPPDTFTLPQSALNIIRESHGSVLVAKGGVKPPPTVIFRNESEVNAYQSGLSISKEVIGGVAIELQSGAMQGLKDAINEARQNGLSITPRGETTAARRSYEDTVQIWNSRLMPGLDYWTRQGKLSPDEADRIRNLSPIEQIPEILKLEAKGMYFSAQYDKSIIYSASAPGASQHLSMLALDVAQFSDPRVRRILAKHGWFQTVTSDLPHFTFLGVSEEQLPELGLKKVKQNGVTYWVPAQ